MNSDIDNLFDSNLNWKTWASDIPVHTAAIAAYKILKESKTMKPDASNSEIILAGVHSCVLATQVLDALREMETDGAIIESMRASALLVLKQWGLELTNKLASVPVAPKAPDKQPEVIVWPPVTPRIQPLGDVYRENFYVAYRDSDVAGAGVPLVLTSSYWSAEDCVWRMLFKIPGTDAEFWLDHTQVKPGDEIPKVIDATTQARSNDP